MHILLHCQDIIFWHYYCALQNISHWKEIKMFTWTSKKEWSKQWLNHLSIKLFIESHSTEKISDIWIRLLYIWSGLDQLKRYSYNFIFVMIIRGACSCLSFIVYLSCHLVKVFIAWLYTGKTVSTHEEAFWKVISTLEQFHTKI